MHVGICARTLITYYRSRGILSKHSIHANYQSHTAKCRTPQHNSNSFLFHEQRVHVHDVKLKVVVRLRKMHVLNSVLYGAFSRAKAAKEDFEEASRVWRMAQSRLDLTRANWRKSTRATAVTSHHMTSAEDHLKEAKEENRRYEQELAQQRLAKEQDHLRDAVQKQCSKYYKMRQDELDVAEKEKVFVAARDKYIAVSRDSSEDSD